jgi:hypothetical protein
VTARVAEQPDVGQTSGSGLPLAEGLLLFAGIPILLTLVLFAICMRGPRTANASQYRPGRTWPGGEVWFGGPEARESDAAASGGRASVESGGASGKW